MIFDTHAHYDDEQFDTDRDELLRVWQQAALEQLWMQRRQ